MKKFKKHNKLSFLISLFLIGPVALIFDRYRWTIDWQDQTGYRIGEIISSISTTVLIKLTLNFHKTNLKKHLNLKN
jgi:hypothetical protein